MASDASSFSDCGESAKNDWNSAVFNLEAIKEE